MGGWVELYPNYFWIFGIFLTLQSPLANPPDFFFFLVSTVSECNLLYLLCTLSATIPGAKRYFRRSLHVREGITVRKSLFWQVYIIQDDRYNTILSALETITKTAKRSLS